MSGNGNKRARHRPPLPPPDSGSGGILQMIVLWQITSRAPAPVRRAIVHGFEPAPNIDLLRVCRNHGRTRVDPARRGPSTPGRRVEAAPTGGRPTSMSAQVRPPGPPGRAPNAPAYTVFSGTCAICRSVDPGGSAETRVATPVALHVATGTRTSRLEAIRTAFYPWTQARRNARRESGLHRAGSRSDPGGHGRAARGPCAGFHAPPLQGFRPHVSFSERGRRSLDRRRNRANRTRRRHDAGRGDPTFLHARGLRPSRGQAAADPLLGGPRPTHAHRNVAGR